MKLLSLAQDAFLLAQSQIPLPDFTAMPTGGPPASVNPGNYSSLINMSALLIVLPMSLLFFGIAWVILNSPAGAPLHKRLAESAFNRKQFARAAMRYEKLHEMQVLMEGNVYARKAALSHELSGNLREAQRWYERAEDWAKLGQLLLESGKIEQAIEIFREHDQPSRLALAFEQLERTIEAGEVYELRLKNLHKAETQYRRAAASRDKETSLHAKLLLARVHHQLQRAEDARQEFDEVSRELDSSPQYQEFPELQRLRSELGQLLQV